MRSAQSAGSDSLAAIRLGDEWRLVRVWQRSNTFCACVEVGRRRCAKPDEQDLYAMESQCPVWRCWRFCWIYSVLSRAELYVKISLCAQILTSDRTSDVDIAGLSFYAPYNNGQDSPTGSFSSGLNSFYKLVRVIVSISRIRLTQLACSTGRITPSSYRNQQRP